MSNAIFQQFDELLKKNADGFIKNKITDPMQHQGFQKQVQQLISKWNLPPDQAKQVQDQIFGPQGWYYKGRGGLGGNTLAFIQQSIQDPTAFTGDKGAAQRQQQQQQQVPVAQVAPPQPQKKSWMSSWFGG